MRPRSSLLLLALVPLGCAGPATAPPILTAPPAVAAETPRLAANDAEAPPAVDSTVVEDQLDTGPDPSFTPPVDPAEAIFFTVKGTPPGAAPKPRSNKLPVVRVHPVVMADASAATTKQIVLKHMAALRGCYESSLRENPALVGALRVHFRIEKDGSAADVTSSSPVESLPDPALVTCVKSVFSGLVFPVPQGGAMTIVYPLFFVLDEAARALKQPPAP